MIWPFNRTTQSIYGDYSLWRTSRWFSQQLSKASLQEQIALSDQAIKGRSKIAIGLYISSWVTTTFSADQLFSLLTMSSLESITMRRQTNLSTKYFHASVKRIISVSLGYQDSKWLTNHLCRKKGAILLWWKSFWEWWAVKNLNYSSKVLAQKALMKG